MRLCREEDGPEGHQYRRHRALRSSGGIILAIVGVVGYLASPESPDWMRGSWIVVTVIGAHLIDESITTRALNRIPGALTHLFGGHHGTDEGAGPDR